MGEVKDAGEGYLVAATSELSLRYTRKKMNQQRKNKADVSPLADKERETKIGPKCRER